MAVSMISCMWLLGRYRVRCLLMSKFCTFVFCMVRVCSGGCVRILTELAELSSTSMEVYRTWRTCRVRYRGFTETFARRRTFLQGFTRASGKGKHFVQVSRNNRVSVWGLTEPIEMSGTGSTRVDASGILKIVLYRILRWGFGSKTCTSLQSWKNCPIKIKELLALHQNHVEFEITLCSTRSRQQLSILVPSSSRRRRLRWPNFRYYLETKNMCTRRN